MERHLAATNTNEGLKNALRWKRCIMAMERLLDGSPRVLRLTVFSSDSGSKTKGKEQCMDPLISKTVETFIDGAGCKITGVKLKW